MIVFNNVANPKIRWPLSVALSEDGGLTWPWVCSCACMYSRSSCVLSCDVFQHSDHTWIFTVVSCSVFLSQLQALRISQTNQSSHTKFDLKNHSLLDIHRSITAHRNDCYWWFLRATRMSSHCHVDCASPTACIWQMHGVGGFVWWDG